MLYDSQYSFQKINTEITGSFHSWLDHDLSLTDKLIATTGHAKLELLSQGWKQSSWWDFYVLTIREQVFLREILMKSQGTLCWYARSVISKSCYDLDDCFFDRLLYEPIKNLIFNEPKVDFFNRLVYPVNQKYLEYYWISRHFHPLPDQLWVRLSTYTFIKNQPFYVVEILTPELLELE